MDANKTIGVVHGGTSHARAESLLYGKHISKVLSELGMEVLDLHLHPNGSWTVNGQTGDIQTSLKKVHAVWNCLVGVDGERGIMEKLCEDCKAKVIGHDVFHSRLVSDKKNLQYALAQHGIKTPYGKVIYTANYNKEKLKEVFASVGIPAVVKPVSGSGAWGVVVINNFGEMEYAVENLIAQNMDVLVEKLIPGIAVSCFVMEHKNLLHTNIKIHDDNANISREDLIKIRNEALYIHNVMAFEHHVEYDFILSPQKDGTKLFFLEANTHPSLVHGYIKKSFASGVVGLKEYIQQKINF